VWLTRSGGRAVSPHQSRTVRTGAATLTGAFFGIRLFSGGERKGTRFMVRLDLGTFSLGIGKSKFESERENEK
jgi:hypothetical protein